LERADLSVLRPRRAVWRRILLDSIGEVAARPQLGNKALGALFDIGGGLALQRQEYLRNDNFARHYKGILVAVVKLALVLLGNILIDRPQYFRLDHRIMLHALSE